MSNQKVYIVFYIHGVERYRKVRSDIPYDRAIKDIFVPLTVSTLKCKRITKFGVTAAKEANDWINFGLFLVGEKAEGWPKSARTIASNSDIQIFYKRQIKEGDIEISYAGDKAYFDEKTHERIA